MHRTSPLLLSSERSHSLFHTITMMLSNMRSSSTILLLLLVVLLALSTCPVQAAGGNLRQEPPREDEEDSFVPPPEKQLRRAAKRKSGNTSGSKDVGEKKEKKKKDEYEDMVTPDPTTPAPVPDAPMMPTLAPAARQDEPGPGIVIPAPPKSCPTNVSPFYQQGDDVIPCTSNEFCQGQDIKDAVNGACCHYPRCICGAKIPDPSPYAVSCL
uniref:Uncharacterized protein n=1 Tax=Cyclophora tenuis TaxID=216820 RepID=A0A7S1GRA8_CYCTE